MKRILIYKQVVANGEYDITNAINYQYLETTVKDNYNNSSPNWANRLWLQGILSLISTNDNEIVFYNSNMTHEYINTNFDKIVLPMANIFWIGHIQSLNNLTEFFEKIKVPTYVIACGVQADSYDDLNQVVSALRVPATRFIKSIYETGGEFALRGYFTKEFFDKLGFSSAYVTGCPSVYQLGANLFIPDNKVSFAEFKPIVNGNMCGVNHILKEDTKILYVDQCDYFNLIINNKLFENLSLKNMITLVREYGYDPVLLASSRRMVLFPEMNEWYNFLLRENYSMSFGSRIHGNIMPILAGIPSVVWTRDSRTREMTEFFDIPNVNKPPQNRKELFQLYLDTDYSKFNKEYNRRYSNYVEFLIEKGLINNNEEINPYLWKKEKDSINYVGQSMLSNDTFVQKLEKNHAMLELDLKFTSLNKRVLDRLKKVCREK